MEEMVSMLCDEILKSYQAGFKEGIKIGYEAGANSLDYPKLDEVLTYCKIT